MAIKIRGIEGMKAGEVDFEIRRGARFVLFQYCISIIVLTFRRASDIYFLRQGENAVTKGLPFTLLSLLAGWWGIRSGRQGCKSRKVEVLFLSIACIRTDSRSGACRGNEAR